MTAQRNLRVAQRAWAVSQRLQPDPRGYLPTVADNLFAPMSPMARAAFEAGSGGETTDRASRDGRPPSAAKMRALHSSSALAVNVFDHWSDSADVAALGAALGVADLRSFVFEAQHPTGLAGIPSNLDVELRLSDGTIAAPRLGGASAWPSSVRHRPGEQRENQRE